MRNIGGLKYYYVEGTNRQKMGKAVKVNLLLCILCYYLFSRYECIDAYIIMDQAIIFLFITNQRNAVHNQLLNSDSKSFSLKVSDKNRVML